MGKELPNLNIVVIGHVDSGKSTTSGQLIIHLGDIDKRIVEKNAKEAQEMGKGSFSVAWIMDNMKNERERGITIDNSLNKFSTEGRQITLIDAPGHRDFIRNMITGASQADCAILIVSAARGEYETGIGKNGQTGEHLLLAKTLGIKYLVIAVNKMDTEDNDGKTFSEKRFNEIQSDLKNYLNNLGFKKTNYSFVPISGFQNENIVEPSDKMPWYKAKRPLASYINDLPVPKRPVKKPLRICLNSRYKIPGIGCVCAGRVETGVMKPGMSVTIMPGNMSTEVKSIEMHHSSVEEAIPGDNVGFNVKNVPFKSIKKGMVVGDPKNAPPKICKEFTANFVVMNHNGMIKVNYSPVIHVHTAHVSCKIVKIEDIYDKRSGKKLEVQPEGIKKNQGAICTFVPEKPLVIEVFKKFSPLGRFSVRDSKVTVGVGVVNDVVFADK